MKLLGIHDGHNASAVLCEDGKVLAGIQEERLRYFKNWTGFPSESIDWLLRYTNTKPAEIDMVVLNGHHMPRDLTKEELIAGQKVPWSLKTRVKSGLKKTFVGTRYTERRKQERRARLIDAGFHAGQIAFIEHHSCHAAAAYHGYGNYEEPVLVLTCDGAGDRICATVSVGEKGKLRRLASVPESESIGNLYACITTLMGFVPLEHEYKLMGMAPYADENYSAVVKKIFWDRFQIGHEDGLTWRRKGDLPPTYYAYWYWRELLEGKRFDSVMGGLQDFVEEFITTWVKNCIRHTGIRKLAMGGGFFMNVKANKAIMELDEVDEVFIFPSCGDEMNAVGACFAYMGECGRGSDIAPLRDIYWGPSFNEQEILNAIKPYQDQKSISAERHEGINEVVAGLLAKGEVVARFAGREEIGARSLGNRAILGDAHNPEVIGVINRMIKNRDFWMPFASSVKAERGGDYFINPKGISAPYMILTFDTTEAGRTELRAGSHPHDGTVRPQVVYREWNPDYWSVIDEFEQLTGRGGILNTSFNLHGYPIVHTPARAVEVLMKSGLRYLQLEHYLIRKN